MDAQLTVAVKLYREQFIMEHFRDSNDIFALVKEGSFCVECERSRFTVGKNEGMLFRRNILYHRTVLTPVTLYLFRYTADAPLFDCDHVIFRDRNRVASTLSMLEALETHILGNDFEYRRHLFSDLVLQYRMENRTASTADAPIEAAMEDIRNALHTQVELPLIAQKTGLSYVQFLRRFKSTAGMTPSDYLISLRLQKAKELLGDTDLLIKEISSACGFENEYYFSNFFKKHTTLSPSAYRLAARS